MKIFEESPNYFYQFLKLDLSFLSDVLGCRTSVKLEQVHIEKSQHFLHEKIASLIEKVNYTDIMNTQIPPMLQNFNSKGYFTYHSPNWEITDEDLNAFLENIFNFVREKSPESYDIDFKELQFTPIFFRKVIALIEERSHSEFRAAFEYLVRRIPWIYCVVMTLIESETSALRGN